MISRMIKGKDGEGNLLTAVGRNWEGKVNKGLAEGLWAPEDQVGGRSLQKTNGSSEETVHSLFFFKTDNMMKLFCARSLLNMVF